MIKIFWIAFEVCERGFWKENFQDRKKSYPTWSCCFRPLNQIKGFKYQVIELQPHFSVSNLH